MRVLVTGGTGFIGSHQTVALIEAGYDVTIVDNSTNSQSELVAERISTLTGTRPRLHIFDVRDTDRLRRCMQEDAIQAIIHLAARKHIAESMADPIGYYRVNIDGLGSVIEAANDCGVRRLVFSSSGSVYGNADVLPIPESAEHRPTNPYSATKSIGEQMLRAQCEADQSWRIVALRYFNPAGAHPSGEIGEDPTSAYTNLLPALMQVAAGQRPFVEVFGDDYDTPDGTGVRDYVHVMDVATAHIDALKRLDEKQGFLAINVGRGVGVSVQELVNAVRKVTGREVPTVLRTRRAGDVSSLFGDTTLANTTLDDTAYRDAEAMCRDAWRWTQQNPAGFRALEAGSAP